MCVCENNKHNDPNSCSHYGLEKNDLGCSLSDAGNFLKD
jgi:hypothetical protein